LTACLPCKQCRTERLSHGRKDGRYAKDCISDCSGVLWRGGKCRQRRNQRTAGEHHVCAAGRRGDGTHRSSASLRNRWRKKGRHRNVIVFASGCGASVLLLRALSHRGKGCRVVACSSCVVRSDSVRMKQEWITVEFLGGPLDGALRPVQVGVAVFYLANGAVIHAYIADEIHEGLGVRQVMRHFEIIHSSRFA